MRVLEPGAPSPEQLKILAHRRPGYYVIKGAAGSGKTSTALLRLRQTAGTWSKMLTPTGRKARVLVLTYNRTLEGYVRAHAQNQITENTADVLEITTFGRWVRRFQPGNVRLIDPSDAATWLRRMLARQPSLTASSSFYLDEIDYLTGKLPPNRINDYLDLRREGRGLSPRMDRTSRQTLLSEVVYPFFEYKKSANLVDWNDLAVLAQSTTPEDWDIVVIDEAQDFSANQVRAVQRHLAADFSATLVMDSMQRIYPRHFTWPEVGITVTNSNQTALSKNCRNTKEIAAFARGIVTGMPYDDDAVLPDFESATSTGPTPTLLVGRYSSQMNRIIQYMTTLDLANESVAFLHPKGGGFFDYTRARLRSARIPYVELSRSSQWPSGPEQVALCTIHSAKGLEFDHVFLLGLNAEITRHGDGENDSDLLNLRRLLAMGVGRAKRSVFIGYKEDSKSSLLNYVVPGTANVVHLP